MKPLTQLFKASSFGLIVILSSFYSSPAHAQTDFSGAWNLDEKKSNLGDIPFRIASDKIVIEQGKDNIVMKRTGQSPMGTIETKDSFTFDGKECQNAFFGDSKKTSIVNWPSKTQMNIKTKASFTGQDGSQIDLDINENYSLSEDGKTLTIDYTSSSSFGDIHQTQVYGKQ